MANRSICATSGRRRRRFATPSARSLRPELYREEYADVFTGNEEFNSIPVAGGALFEWDPDSTYIKEPPFFFIDLDAAAGGADSRRAEFWL